MAVYTPVPFAAAADLFQDLGLGALATLEPCAGGIENTNYFADTDRGRYVLTLFERLGASELPYYLRLVQHLARRDAPVPAPHEDAHGEVVLHLAGKPAAVVDRLPGGHRLSPDAADCRRVGAEIARLHLAAADFALAQANPRGLAWWRETVPVVAPHVDAGRAALLHDELAFQEQLAASPAFAALPRGAIHADLFRDNVMFEGDRVSGVFDFYFAGDDAWLFDVAVALNDWCTDLGSGRLDEARAQALVAGYAALRPLGGDELRLLPALLRAAALRFWLSRLWDACLPREAVLLKAHDPAPFERILVQRRDVPWHPALGGGAA